MRIFNIVFYSILVCSISSQAQNVFTFAGNGTFETSDSEWLQELQTSTTNAGFTNSTMSRSPNQYKEGNYSLKVEQIITTTQAKGSVMFPFVNNNPFRDGLYPNPFGVSLWVYIPSSVSENPLLGSGGVLSVQLRTMDAGHITVCHDSYGEMEVNKWIQINPIMSKNISVWISGGPVGSTLVYYIDKVEAVYSTPIVGEVFQLTENRIPLENSITLTNPPSGGMQYIQGIEPANPGLYPGTIYNSTYSYKWGDGDVTTPNRINLKPRGTVFSVTITNPSETEVNSCHISKTLKFLNGRPDPPSANDVTICANQSATLVATDLAPQYYRGLSWYDALEGGNRLSTNGSWTPPVFTTPGIYKFYAQVDIIGDVQGLPSDRKEVIVTVNPLPDPLKLSATILFKGHPLVIESLNHQPGNQYNYKFYYGSGANTTFEQFNSTPVPGKISYTFHDLGALQPAAGFHNIVVSVVNGFGCSKTFNYTVEVKNYIPLCETVIPAGANVAQLDKFSGQIVFQKGTTCPQSISLGCIQGKVCAPSLTNVVSASAATFSDRWTYDEEQYQYPFSSLDPFETGERGKWRTEATYAFNTGGILYDQNYNSGTFTLRPFNWRYPKSSQRMGWIEANHVDKYSPNGEAVEEHNALNISSAAKFGYGGSVPYLIAKNADYNSVLFEGFEYMTNNKFEDGFVYSAGGGMQLNSSSHSGNGSLAVSSNAGIVVRSFNLSNHVKSKGLLVKVWAKGTSVNMGLMINSTTKNFTPLIRTGEWMLYQAMVTPTELAELQSLTIGIKNQSSTTLLIDDLRIQPQDAAMTAYVYDKNNLRLLAIFDDQHFGLYYQYNAEGKLVRKIIETERGMKTLQETQYNTPPTNN